MRILRWKLDETVRQFLAGLRVEFGFYDQHFVEDCFVFFALKGTALPSDSDLTKLTAFYKKHSNFDEMAIGAILRKRAHSLSVLRNSPLFGETVASISTSSVTTAFRVFLGSVRRLNSKVRCAQCRGCQFLSACDFGKQYAHIVGNLRVVTDPDYKRKAHAQCPHIPDLEFANNMLSSLNVMSRVSKDSEFSNQPVNPNDPEATYANFVENYEFQLEKGGYHTVFPDLDEDGDVEDYNVELHQFNGGGADLAYYAASNKNLIATPTKMVENLSVQDLGIYFIGMTLDGLLEAKVRNKFKPVPTVARKQDQRNIKSVSEAAKLTTLEQSQDDAVLNARIAKGKAQVKEHLDDHAKPQCLHVIFDVSGSMGSPIGTIQGYPFTRALLVQVFMLSLCRRLQKDKGALFCRPFSGSPGPLITAIKPDEFKSLAEQLMAMDFSQGGTNISGAIMTALEDLEASRHKVTPKEVLLLTDGDDYGIGRNEQQVAALLAKSKGVKLNTLLCDGMRGTPSGLMSRELASLRRLSTRFFQTDRKAPTLKELVSLVADEPPPLGSNVQSSEHHLD